MSSRPSYAQLLAFEVARELDPTHPAALTELAIAVVPISDKPGEAVEAIEEAIRFLEWPTDTRPSIKEICNAVIFYHKDYNK